MSRLRMVLTALAAIPAAATHTAAREARINCRNHLLLADLVVAGRHRTNGDKP